MSGLMGGGGGGASIQRYAGMQVSTSLQGQVIPYVAGRTRIPMNLGWYGNFKSTGSGSGGKGGGGPSSWTYSTAFIGLLSLGPIHSINQVWHDQSLVSLSYENLAFALGTSGQATWSGYPSSTPTVQKIPYDHLAYVATNSYALGSSPAMPNLTFEVEGCVPGFSNAHGMFDADAAAIVLDYLTDAVHGAAFQGTIATLTGSTNTYQAYCMSLGLLVSPLENNQRSATDFLKELMQITNSDIVLSCGNLKVIPYADTAVSGTTADGSSWSYTPNLTPVFSFTDSDYCPNQGDEPVKLTRKALSDTYNIINVEYLDRTNYYNPAPVSASDNWDISIRGPRAMSTLSFHQITGAQVAKTVAQLVLQFQLYERNTWEFRVRADYSLLEPMDYIAITDTILGLANQVCRIVEIDDDADDFITIKAMEVPGTVRNTPQYNWNAAQGYAANFDAAPGSVVAPTIFAMPPIPGALSDGITLGIAVCGATANALWGGCQVYCSVDGGSTYDWVGTIGGTGVPRYGSLTASISAVADPDTASTLSVALVNTTLQLSTSVTHAEADSAQTLILVGQTNTAEVMSYGAGSLTSAGHYNLSYLRRGLYGSTIQAHSSSDSFVRLDGDIFQIAMDPGYAGQAVSFKFTSFNYVGRATEALASVTAYSYTIPSALPVGGSVFLIPRGTCAVNGNNVYKQPNGAAAWDSDAYSPQGFLNGCFVSWRAAEITSTTMVGFSTNPTASVSFTSLNFALYQNVGAVQIEESGSLMGTFGTYAIGDNFEIRYDGVTVRYFRNGTLIRAVRAPGLTLYPKVCMFAGNCVVSNVQYGPASAVNQPTGSLLNTYPWVIGSTGSQGNYADAGASGIVLGAGPYGTSEALWYSSGTGAGFNGGWNNSGDLYGFDSTKTYRSVVWVLWNGGGTTSTFFYHGPDTTYTNNIGGTPNSNPYYTGSIVVSGTLAPGKWYLAVGFLHGSSYASADSGLSGIYDPLTGNRLVAGNDFVCVANAPHQTQRVYHYNDVTSGSFLYFSKPRFEEVNGNEPSITTLISPAGVLAYADNLDEVPNGSTYAKTLAAYISSGVPYTYRGAYSGSTAYKIGDETTSGGNYYICTVANTGSTPPSADWTLLGPVTIDDLQDGVTYARPLAGYLSNGVPYTYRGAWSGSTAYKVGDEVTETGNYYICTIANTGSAPPSADWTLLGPVTLDDLANGVTYARPLSGYLVNGVPYTNRGAYSGATAYKQGDEVTLAAVTYLCVANTTGNSPPNVSFWQVVGTPTIFIATGNCLISDTTATKQGGSAAWDSCVYSINGFATCHIVAKPNGTSGTVMIGLATSPTASSSFTNMNYGWYNDAGTWQIYESGTLIGSFGSVSLSDVAAVTYDGSTITYLLNGASSRTVAVSGLILYGFCPFNLPGTGINSLSFGPTTNLAVIDTGQVGANAVSQIVSATRSGTSSYSFQSAIVDVDDLTVSITTTGNPIGIDVTFELEVASNGGTFVSPMTATITRGGSPVGTATVNIFDYVTNTTPTGAPAALWTVQQTLTVVDAPAAGTYTYALHLHAAQAGGGTVHNFGTVNPVLKVREYKK